MMAGMYECGSRCLSAAAAAERTFGQTLFASGLEALLGQSGGRAGTPLLVRDEMCIRDSQQRCSRPAA